MKRKSQIRITFIRSNNIIMGLKGLKVLYQFLLK